MGRHEIQRLDVSSEASAWMDAFQAAGFVSKPSSAKLGDLPVNGQRFDQYIESLPSVLKNTLQRKQRKLEKALRASEH